MSKLPKNFKRIMDRYEDVIRGLDVVKEKSRQAGPLDEKTAHLLQLASAAAMRLEGAVHSHAKRALESGASAEEVRHALILVIPTIGFPAVAAALSWVDDLMEED